MPIVPKDWKWVYDPQTGEGDWAPPGFTYKCDYNRFFREEKQKLADRVRLTPLTTPYESFVEMTERNYRTESHEEPNEISKEIAWSLASLLWPIYQSLPEAEKRKFELALERL